MTIRIIGAGLGRTGTTSLKAALEQLGFGPCYHMTEVLKHPTHIRAWEDAAAGIEIDWPALFGKYQATVDFPACTFYKVLMDAYPDAKVILSVRDPERWYESAYETIYLTLQAVPFWSRWLPWVGDLHRMTMQLLWKQQFGGRFEDRAHAIRLFNQWNEEVRATVPADKLLIFDVKEGWEPLCEFLGVAIPATPFPHANDRTKMLMGRRALHAVNRWLPIITGITIPLQIFWAVSKLRATR